MAVRFDAEENYSSTSSPPGATFTVTCLAYLSVDRDQYSTFWESAASTTDFFLFSTDFNGQIPSLYVNDATLRLAGSSMTVGQWYQFGMVRTATTAATLYHGLLGGSLTAVSASGLGANTPTTLRIGASVFTNEWLNGRITAFKQWDAALTAAEVSAELRQYSPRRSTNLVRFHPFQIAETTDYSGNGRTLTVTGSPTTEDGPTLPWARSVVALTHIGSTTWAAPASAATVSPTYPSGLADATTTQTDVVYAVLHIKPDTATVATPTNWSLVASAAGGSGTQGVGTGATRMHLYRRTATAALSGTTEAFTITGGSSPVAFMRAYRASGTNVAFDVETTTSWSVTTASTTIDGTAGAGLDVAALDEINCVLGTTDDTTTTLTLTGLTATGATLGALTRDPNATVTNAQGNDIAATAYRISVDSGASNVAPVATATANAAETAMGFLFRVRATADVLPPTEPILIDQAALIRAHYW